MTKQEKGYPPPFFNLLPRVDPLNKTKKIVKKLNKIKKKKLSTRQAKPSHTHTHTYTYTRGRDY